MPIHDWTRVSDETFYAFHLSWISEIQLALNGGLLPREYYAQAEHNFGLSSSESLTPAHTENEMPFLDPGSSHCDTAVDTGIPRARMFAEAQIDAFAAKRRTIFIRHAGDDRNVAMLDIVAPGTKSSKYSLRSFVQKSVEALHRGYQLLVIDLLPPGRHDPLGIHGAIWGEIGDTPYTPPPGEPLTLVAYTGGSCARAFIEPTALGKELVDRPLFLDTEFFIDVPLEETYMSAYQGVPRRWREKLEKRR